MTQTNLPAQRSLPVALDAMGGDFGIRVTVEGAVLAARELAASSILVGDQSQIESRLKELGASSESRLSILHTPQSITMDESPSAAIRRKADSSMHKVFELVKEGKAGSCVSAGNTGAFMAVGVMISGVLPGVVRPPIASLIPNLKNSAPTVLLDVGANVDCHAYQLVQFALMGSYYAASVLGCSNPRVALLSNGAEPSKGNDVIRSAAVALSQIPRINFIGYAEGNDIGRGKADVIVCDGFSGNVLLKGIEGTVQLVLETIEEQSESSLIGKFGMWLSRPSIKSVFHSKLDPSSYGGAPLLGLNSTAVICHGASTPRGIMNGIRVARMLADDGMVAKLSRSLREMELDESTGVQDGVWARVGKRFDDLGKKDFSK
jgi:glycerol-3-phosphate acyltransferase PlsX